MAPAFRITSATSPSIGWTTRTMRADGEPKPAKCGDPGAIRTRGPQIRNLMLYPAELRGLGPTNRDSRADDQFTWFGGTTGSGSGATGTPSSTSDFACSSVALPWT